MESKNEIDFTMCANTRFVQDVGVLGKVKSGDHRTVRSSISLYWKRGRRKVATKKQAIVSAVRRKLQQFSLLLQDRYSALTQEVEERVEAMNYKLTKIIT